MSQRSKSLKKFREMDAAALGREEGELRGGIWKMQVQRGTGQATDPLKIGEARRDLARLLTVRREREGKAS
jgi:ribosomal protein L29